MKILIILFLLISFNHSALPQNDFVYCKDEKFYKENSEFYFLGFSAYYLQWMSSDSSRKYIIDDVFNMARQAEIKVIRTWGFNSDSDSTNQTIIRYSPYSLKKKE